jgi:hypothetical protein
MHQTGCNVALIRLETKQMHASWKAGDEQHQPAWDGCPHQMQGCLRNTAEHTM